MLTWTGDGKSRSGIKLIPVLASPLSAGYVFTNPLMCANAYLMSALGPEAPVLLPSYLAHMVAESPNQMEFGSNKQQRDLSDISRPYGRCHDSFSFVFFKPQNVNLMLPFWEKRSGKGPRQSVSAFGDHVSLHKEFSKGHLTAASMCNCFDLCTNTAVDQSSLIITSDATLTTAKLN